MLTGSGDDFSTANAAAMSSMRPSTAACILLLWPCKKSCYSALRGTYVEKELIAMTQVPDPLLPGSLRHTTDALMQLVTNGAPKKAKLDKRRLHKLHVI